MPAHEQRRLTTIVAADVAGYGRLTGADEEGTMRRLRALRAELIYPAIEAKRGRVFKTTGDGMLMEFASVVAIRHSRFAICLLPVSGRYSGGCRSASRFKGRTRRPIDPIPARRRRFTQAHVCSSASLCVQTSSRPVDPPSTPISLPSCACCCPRALLVRR